MANPYTLINNLRNTVEKQFFDSLEAILLQLAQDYTSQVDELEKEIGELLSVIENQCADAEKARLSCKSLEADIKQRDAKNKALSTENKKLKKQIERLMSSPTNASFKGLYEHLNKDS